MIAELLYAYTGRVFWNRICNTHKIDFGCAVLVMIEDDENWNAHFLKYLNVFCSVKKLDRIVILTTDSVNFPSEYKGIYRDSISTISHKEYLCLLDYYLLIKFSDSIIFCAKNSPQDNTSSYILDKSDISLDEYICYGVYKLRGIPNV